MCFSQVEEQTHGSCVAAARGLTDGKIEISVRTFSGRKWKETRDCASKVVFLFDTFETTIFHGTFLNVYDSVLSYYTRIQWWNFENNAREFRQNLTNLT